MLLLYPSNLYLPSSVASFFIGVSVHVFVCICMCMVCQRITVGASSSGEAMAWSCAMNCVKEHLPALVSTASTSNPRDSSKGPKKRPHQSTGKNGIDDDDLTDKKRRLTVEQIKYLEMSFNMDLKLEPERKALLAKQLGLRPRQVAIWFQNRRARWKNKQVEQDYETLKASYDVVLKEKESLIKECESAMEGNKKLQAEVARLTNLLQGVKNKGMEVTSLAVPRRKEEQVELMSPTKSADCQSDVEDVVMPADANKHVTASPFLQELDLCALRVEGDCSFFMSSENVLSSLPLLVQQLIANGHCFEDAYNIFLGCEYFGGGWR